LSRRFYDEARASGVGEAEYVEIVGIVAQITNVDSFCRALGVALHPLPEPVAGAPTRRRPQGAKPGLAWVATIAPADARGPEARLYPRLPQLPNVVRALSLVPDEVRGILSLGNVQYVPMEKLMELTAQRTLTRPQMELIAGRVSALNQCFY
jgi:alkylhydroperoxidase family enzyme